MPDQTGHSPRLVRAPREIVKRSLRGAGAATVRWRPPPDFLIIGAKRGGTTSFYYDLLSHPSILRMYPPPIPVVKADATKGVHFFDSSYGRGPRWYLSHMPTAATRALNARRNGVDPVVGEASPYYLFHPAAAERAAQLVPDVKVIALLRDPVMRTYSHWKERRRSDAEPLGFWEALEAEPERLEGERERLQRDPSYLSYAWEQQSYAAQSRYAESLRPWVELFGRDRVLVRASEDYYADPAGTLAEVHRFLGIPPRSVTTGRIRNAARGDDLPDDIRSELGRRFAEPNRELEELLQRPFPW